jgi:16S rRNA G966 N2-methylase RsmD
VFCERDRTALRTLRHNLELTGLAGRATVVAGDAFAYLARPQAEAFDIIYIAPPQYQELWLRALRLVDDRPEVLTSEGQAIVQIFPKEWAEPKLVNMILIDERRYGSTALFFFGLSGAGQ